MTDKQRDCIDWICSILDIDYCGKDTVRDAWVFIHKYMGEAKEVYKKNQLQ